MKAATERFAAFSHFWFSFFVSTVLRLANQPFQTKEGGAHL